MNPGILGRRALAPVVIILASGIVCAQSAPDPTVDSALKVLNRAAGLFSVYAARAGSTLTVVTELTPQSSRSGRWKDGADLDLTLSDDDGDVVGSAHGQIGGGADAVALTLQIPDAAVRATVRVRDDRGTAADGVKLDPPTGTVVGDPIAYRSSSRVAPHPVADFEFARNERIRIEWPVLGPLEKRAVRLLDHGGRPIPVDLPLANVSDRKMLATEMGLSGFAPGDYVIELTATAGAATDRKLLAVRIK